MLYAPFWKNMHVQTGSAKVFALPTLNNGEEAPVCKGKHHEALDWRLLFRIRRSSGALRPARFLEGIILNAYKRNVSTNEKYYMKPGSTWIYVLLLTDIKAIITFLQSRLPSRYAVLHRKQVIQDTGAEVIQTSTDTDSWQAPIYLKVCFIFHEICFQFLVTTNFLLKSVWVKFSICFCEQNLLGNVVMWWMWA